jgi:hypothetical protein
VIWSLKLYWCDDPANLRLFKIELRGFLLFQSDRLGKQHIVLLLIQNIFFVLGHSGDRGDFNR